VIDALGWTLVHFLWQGALLGVAAWAVLRALPEQHSEARYAAACALFGVMVLCPLATLTVMWPNAAALSVTPLAGVAHATATSVGFPETPRAAPWTAWAVALWTAGLALMAARAAGGWVWVWRRQNKGRRPLPDPLQDTVRSLAVRMGLHRAIRWFASVHGDTPQVFGWAKPVVLVPLSALTSMPAQQLEALLAHELAHIRRHDFLVNAVQVLAEIVLFYHPAVWWLSARVREEREACCDRVAAQVCGDTLLYGRALLALEESRERYALAASGFGLARRVRRLLSGGQDIRPVWLLAAVITASLLIAATSANWLLAQVPAPPAPPEAPAASTVPPPPTPPAVPALIGGYVPADAAPARLTDDEFRAFCRDFSATYLGMQRKEFPTADFGDRLAKLFEKYGPFVRWKDGRPVAKEYYSGLLIRQMAEGEGTGWSPAHLRWVQEEVVYLITPEERAAFFMVKNAEERDEFIRQFWQRRPGREMEHTRRLVYANQRYGSLTADRSRAYVLWGPPDEIESPPPQRYEIWRWRDGRTLRFEGPDLHLAGQWPRP